MALMVEAAEPAEHFQWLTQEQSSNLSEEKLAAIKDEIGDVVIYLANLSDKLGIDPLGAGHEKLEKNKQRDLENQQDLINMGWIVQTDLCL